MIASRALILSAGALTLLQLPAVATAVEPGEGNKAIRPLLDCRKIVDAGERLSCFDKESATLDEADRKNELTVMNKDDVRKTRRSLFGLNLDGLPFLGGGGDKDDASAEQEEGRSRITAKVLSARALGYGKWAFELDNGANWVTTEAVPHREPEAGGDVVIKRGALGSYRASFGGSVRPVQVKRVN